MSVCSVPKKVRNASLVFACALLLVWTPNGSAEANTEQNPVERSDPRWLTRVMPLPEEYPGFLHTFTEFIRPGESYGYPVEAVESIFSNRRFVSANMLGYESLDQRLSFIVVLIDVGDPNVYSTVNLEGWTSPNDGSLPAGTLIAPRDRSDEPYKQLTLAWSRGPLMVVLDTVNLSQANSRYQMREQLAPIATAIAESAPVLSVVPPVGPATPYQEGVLVGTSLATLLFTLVVLRWLIAASRDHATRRRFYSHMRRRRELAALSSKVRVDDVTGRATAYLWATRLINTLQLAILLALAGLSAGLFVLLRAGWPLRTTAAGFGLLALCLAWLGAPRLVGIISWVLSRGSFRPKVLSRRRDPIRWFRAPGYSVVALLGLMVSLALVAVGFSLVLRASYAEATGALGAIGPEETKSVRTGFLVMGATVLAFSAVPFSISRRMAQRSVRASLGIDKRSPVLLLRSFGDDLLRMRAHRTARHLVFTRLRLSTTERFEEILVWSLWRWGPVTTLGQPGSRLPPLGAAREFYADENWHAGVANLIGTAALIVVVVDCTESLEWEIAEIRRQGVLARCIFVVPPVALAERQKRLKTLERQLGLEPALSPLEPSTELLSVRVDASGMLHVCASRFRDSLSYEVAIEVGATACWEPRPVLAVGGVPPKLERPAPRGTRPKRKSRSQVTWAIAGVLFAFTGALSLLSPGEDLPERVPPDDVVELTSNILRMQVRENGALFLPTSRRNLVFASSQSDDYWEYAVPISDRIRAINLGPTVVALSTFESSTLTLVAISSGDEIARMDIEESAGSVLVADNYVFAARPMTGDVMIADLDGRAVQALDIEGVPVSLAASEEEVVVGSAGTGILTVISLDDLSVQTVKVGEPLRGLTVSGESAYSIAVDEGEVIEVDLDSGETVRRVAVPEAFPGLSNFDPVLASDRSHLAVPILEKRGVPGIQLIDRVTLRVERVIWSYELGHQNLFFWRGGIYTGSTAAPGLFGWTVPT